MVLLEPPEKPKRWQFKEKSTEPRQTTLLQYTGGSGVGNVASQSSLQPGDALRRSAAQIVPDNQREWSPPKQLSLCRKGFLVRTNVPENRELVERLIRDLTYNYPESRFEKQMREQRQQQFWHKAGGEQRAGGASSGNKPPLHCFCSFASDQAEHLLVHSHEDANRISEGADWIQSLEDSAQRANKKRRAELASYLLVPKFFLLEQLKGRDGVEFDDHNVAGQPMADTLQFTEHRRLVETERRPQVSATTFALKHLRRTGGAVLVLPVGCGKTVCALYIAMQLRVCTLIVVGNENLIEQWYERIEEYCPGARIGRIQGSVCETQDCDFVIACTKSLSERPYSVEKLRRIGMVIFDEAHHAAAPTFLTAVWQVAAPYMLALSADPTRQDGMTHVLYHFFSYNVFVVLPSLPPGIELHVGLHRFSRRCFVQDADCVSANRLRDRRHNADKDAEKLEYCEALASFDKRHYAKACLSSAALPLVVTNGSSNNNDNNNNNAGNNNDNNTGLPGVASLHALSGWQSEFAEADVAHLNYTQVYQTLQCDAHRNATIVAYTKQLLRQNNVALIRAPTPEECNDLSEVSVFERERAHVKVRVGATGETKLLSECTRQDVQTLQQLERQILILASEKQHIDALHDRFLRSGFPEHMIGVYVGGTSYTKEQRAELKSRRVVLATFAIAGEGTDIATLNTIIFATPRSGITDQAIGRALRDKLTPLIMPFVLDLIDNWCQMTKRMYYTRNRSYKFYNAINHLFDDFASYDAIGAVCWRKPRRNRTQRVSEEKKLAREQAKAEKSAERERLKAERSAERERLKAEKSAERERLKQEKAAQKENNTTTTKLQDHAA